MGSSTKVSNAAEFSHAADSLNCGFFCITWLELGYPGKLWEIIYNACMSSSMLPRFEFNEYVI